MITLALFAARRSHAELRSPPLWVIVSAAFTIGIGTYSGGRRIIRTLGMRLVKLYPPHGFAAETPTRVILWIDGLPRFPGLDDAHHHDLGAGRRRDAAAIGGALGRRGQHPRSPG